MYERFYDLRERPFALSPDPSYLYRSGVHSEALSYLRYGLEGYAGFVVITGEVGSGKTTMLQTALRGLDQQTSVARLINTMFDARELIEAVMLDFGIEPDPTWSKPRLLRALARYLVEQRQAGRLALLVIDEAQNLTLAALEEVRMLSNFETERSKLIQIVLVGQPSLRDTLARPELEQLRQRVTVSYHLRALDRSETAGYVNHRLRLAALGTPFEFAPDVTDLIHRYSNGVPRTINVIADAVLLFGYGEDCRHITADLTRRAIDDLVANRVLTPAPGSGLDADPSSVRERDLQAREMRLVQRERQLLEQQVVLDDQLKLLADKAFPATSVLPPLPVATTTAPKLHVAPVVTAAPLRPVPIATVPHASAPPRAASVSTPPVTLRRTDARVPSLFDYPSTNSGEGIWSRLRRGLFGERRAGVED